MLLERTSTLQFGGTLRSSIRQLQVDLQKAQSELSTGRHSDVGLVLGLSTGRNLDWRNKIENLGANLKRNETIANRASVSQAAIDSIVKQSESLRDAVMGARSALNGGEVAHVAGGNALDGILNALSTEYAGQFIFAGRTPDQAPLSQYSGQAPQVAFDAAFLAEFGFAKDDPLAANITPSQMQTFLNGRFEDLFSDPAWSSDWSQSDSQNMEFRIAENVVVNVDANGNEQAFRKVLKAAVAVFELGNTSIGSGTLQTVADKAMSEISNGVQELGNIQSRIGLAEQSITRANSRMTAMKAVFETSVADTEGVSQFDAATRVNTLMSQLESSYTVTGRLFKLSLMNYL